jgi:hypothetical protein
MNSLEKLAQLREHLAGPPSADADPLELAVRTAARFGGELWERLPQNPDDLDDVLAKIAATLLEFRSDDAAEELGIFVAPSGPAELVDEHPAEAPPPVPPAAPAAPTAETGPPAEPSPAPPPPEQS